MDGENQEAGELYRLLLKQTPSDNQGVWCLLAGMYAGVGSEDVDDMFEIGNERQDWSELESMLDEQNSKYHFWNS